MQGQCSPSYSSHYRDLQFKSTDWDLHDGKIDFNRLTLTLTLPANKFMLKVNNTNTFKKCGICSKLPVNIYFNFEHI